MRPARGLKKLRRAPRWSPTNAGERQGAREEMFLTAEAVEKRNSGQFQPRQKWLSISRCACSLKFFAPRLHFFELSSSSLQNPPRLTQVELRMSSSECQLMFDRWLYTLCDEDRAYFMGDPEAIPLFMAGWKQFQSNAKRDGVKATEEEVLAQYLKEWVEDRRPSENIDLGEFEDPRYSGHLASMPGIRILDVEPIARIDPEDDGKGKGKRKTCERVQPSRKGKRGDGSSSGR